MKKEVSPVTIGIVIVIVIGLLGYFGYRSFGVRTVDTPETMSAEVKAKMDAAYGGGRSAAPAGAPAARP